MNNEELIIVKMLKFKLLQINKKIIYLSLNPY